MEEIEEVEVVEEVVEQVVLVWFLQLLPDLCLMWTLMRILTEQTIMKQMQIILED